MKCPRCKGTGNIKIATLSDRRVMWRELRGISMREASRQIRRKQRFSEHDGNRQAEKPFGRGADQDR